MKKLLVLGVSAVAVYSAYKAFNALVVENPGPLGSSGFWQAAFDYEYPFR